MTDFAATDCGAGGCSPSALAMLVPLLAGLLAVVFAVICWRIARRARRASGSGLTIVAASLGATAVLCLCLLVASFWEYGGTAQTGDGQTMNACASWWYEIDPPARGDAGNLDRHCHEAAMNAIGPAIGWAVGIAAVAAAALFVLISARRKRFDQGLAHLITGESQ